MMMMIMLYCIVLYWKISMRDGVLKEDLKKMDVVEEVYVCTVISSAQLADRCERSTCVTETMDGQVGSKYNKHS